MNLLKRYIILLAGLSIMAFGVAFSIKAGLGTSPISSVPYVVSLFSNLTVGTATIAMHLCIYNYPDFNPKKKIRAYTTLAAACGFLFRIPHGSGSLGNELHSM